MQRALVEKIVFIFIDTGLTPCFMTKSPQEQSNPQRVKSELRAEWFCGFYNYATGDFSCYEISFFDLVQECGSKF